MRYAALFQPLPWSIAVLFNRVVSWAMARLNGFQDAKADVRFCSASIIHNGQMLHQFIIFAALLAPRARFKR
jgi:hypothetical protein